LVKIALGLEDFVQKLSVDESGNPEGIELWLLFLDWFNEFYHRINQFESYNSLKSCI